MANEAKKQSPIVLVLIIIVAALAGYLAYDQFGKDEADFNIELPGGESISGSVSE